MLKFPPFVRVNWLGNFFDYQSVNTRKCATFSSFSHSATPISYILSATKATKLPATSYLLSNESSYAFGSWRHLMPLTAKSCRHKEHREKMATLQNGNRKLKALKKRWRRWNTLYGLIEDIY